MGVRVISDDAGYSAGEIRSMWQSDTSVPESAMMMMTGKAPRRLTLVNIVALIGVLTLLQIPQACGGDFVFTRIADNSVTAPGKSVRFQRFDNPAMDGSTVAFLGIDRQRNQGIYIFDGGNLTRITDENTLVPHGGGAKFVAYPINGVSVDQGNVAFGALVPDRALGVYAYIDGVLSVVADRDTAVFDKFATFTEFPNVGGVDISGRVASLECCQMAPMGTSHGMTEA